MSPTAQPLAPHPTERLQFRRMGPADLDSMASLLGDPEVMAFYPVPKTRAEAANWISWNERNYAELGHGLWIVETREGEFLGDAGLTMQPVNGVRRLEVGYHIRSERQGNGFATEAAAACRDYARDQLHSREMVAIIHPENLASRRVAEKIGMTHIDDDHEGSIPARVVMGMDLDSRRR